jgi:hypothetical protein
MIKQYDSMHIVFQGHTLVEGVREMEPAGMLDTQIHVLSRSMKKAPSSQSIIPYMILDSTQGILPTQRESLFCHQGSNKWKRFDRKSSKSEMKKRNLKIVLKR